MKRDDKQPETRPTAMGIQKLRSVVRAKISETTTMVITASKVVIVVTMVLVLT